MKKMYFNGTTKEGSHIINATITVSNEATMTEIVKAIKAKGYVNFLLAESNMKVYADVPENI